MDLHNRSAEALLVGAVIIASLHALIPSHWLAFALVGRAQRWTMHRTLSAVALAGTGHVLMTTTLGFFLAAAGKNILRWIPPSLEHAATGGLLVVLGAYFALISFRRDHSHHGPSHPEPDLRNDTVEMEADAAGAVALAKPASRMNLANTTLGAMALGMTLSPCLDLLPIYTAAATLPWGVIIAISIVMACVTLGIMVGLVWLTLHGLSRLNLRWLEHNEGLVVGGVLIALGVWLFL